MALASPDREDAPAARDPTCGMAALPFWKDFQKL
jgi:hypothetical protein